MLLFPKYSKNPSVRFPAFHKMYGIQRPQVDYLKALQTTAALEAIPFDFLIELVL